MSNLSLIQGLTLSWCKRRAEAVLKVIKGTLMELVGARTFGGCSLQTLIFLLPTSSSSPEVSGPALFEALVGIINSTFQQTNPIIVDVSNSA